MTTYLPEGMRLHTMENQTALQSVAALQAAMHRKQILEARAIVCDAAHNLIVELPHMRGIIPREEGAIGIAEGTTREIALIAKAGKPVCFQVQKLTTDTDGVPLAILSRRQAQLQCWQEFLSHCTPGDVLPARVTHMEKFGCFVDIGCGIPSMIPIDCISVSRISHRESIRLPTLLLPLKHCTFCNNLDSRFRKLPFRQLCQRYSFRLGCRFYRKTHSF